ncbi:unnamed protein product [Eruca vesicaria subsp. sativa]|uniref:Uncharacterized protein n=1 Tax=Eruca vesicaria subsp. sativa TaxID=29727 RepID=A0ABC8IZW9_ERUVS|nr:unnamed protein product [Eruca vesicaria subsp. sativa]
MKEAFPELWSESINNNMNKESERIGYATQISIETSLLFDDSNRNIQPGKLRYGCPHRIWILHWSIFTTYLKLSLNYAHKATIETIA